MSWSISIGPTPVKELKASLDVAAVNGIPDEPDGAPADFTQEVALQIAQAKKGALAIVKAKAVGDAHSVYVSLWGHVFDGESIEGANPTSMGVSVSEAPVALEPATVEDTGEGVIEEPTVEEG